MANRVTFVLVFVLIALISPTARAVGAGAPNTALLAGLAGHLFTRVCDDSAKPLIQTLSAGSIAFGVAAIGLRLLWG
ncbi:MAG: hypothetical protein AAGA92_05920 [Planctomycetota bacterium]